MSHEQQDAVSAILARERSRARMRVATVTVGVAALATAGAVAYNLPAPTPKKVVATVVTPATTQPAAPVVTQYYGDDGEGGTRTSTPSAAPGSTATKAPSHTTSGGS